MKLHPQLSLLVAGAVAPVLVLAVAAGALLVRHERQTMQSEAIGRTRSAMSAVDAEIRGHFTSLQALAASRNLETGNMTGFYDEAQRVIRSQPDWLAGTTPTLHVVVTPDGERIERRFVHRLYSVKEWAEMLGEAGFQAVDAFGAWDGETPITPEVWRLILRAR